MLRIHRSRRNIAFSAVIAITVLLVATTQTAFADISQLRRVLACSECGFILNFSGDMGGRVPRDAILQISPSQISDSGSFTGKYYPYSSGPPAANNVTGTIAFVGDPRGAQAVRITFTVTERTASGITTAVDTFEGALRLGPVNSHIAFMAGTYTTNRTAPGLRQPPGPYPFCATLEELPPG